MPEFKVKMPPQEKLFSRLWFENYALIVLGSMILALGIVFFIVPHHLVPGGVFGLSIALSSLLGFSIGTLALCINIPLLLLGLGVIGKKFGVKTLFSFVLTSIFVDGVLHFIPEPLITKDILVSALFGGGIMGLGVAIVVRAGATTGGTDLVAQLLSRKFRISMGRSLIAIDGMILLFGVFVFKDLDLASYGIIAIIALSRTVDVVLSGLNVKKFVVIISERHQEIRNFVLESDCGGTMVKGRGLFFLDNEKQIIMSAMDPKSIYAISRFAKSVDPSAFIAVMNTSDVIGNGFSKV
jgi:uncharacterized membrane-anchored protein YitT (DUF2179 family)